jgi:hypothetical protein
VTRRGWDFIGHGLYILNDAGEPVAEPDLLTWAAWYETADRTVAQTRLDHVSISTVFLGIDHAFTGGPPRLWETMIFGGPLDGYAQRYASRAAALAGHEAAVDVARTAAARP